MSEYLSYGDIEAMSMDLEVYDADQNGWEHEAKGLEFNLNHTLKELVRARRKDFYDPDVVRAELAPDAMQFALRLARWTGFKRELVLPGAQTESYVNAYATRIRTAARRIGAFAAGEVMLANYTHKLDHASEREEAIQTKFIHLPPVSKALMLFALDSANEFDFNPRNSFVKRLSDLRERFGIPQPS